MFRQGRHPQHRSRQRHQVTRPGRRFEIEVNPEGLEPLTIAPQAESGNYFNTQERHVRSFQWVESISLTRNWRGEHVIKTGADVQWARFDGTSENRPVEVRRLDGSLAERTIFAGLTEQEVAGTEVAMKRPDSDVSVDAMTPAGRRVM